MFMREFRNSFENVPNDPLVVFCAHCNGPCKAEQMHTRLLELSDKVDDMQQRLDRFHEWAEVLQKEFRSLHKRQKSVELKCADSGK